MKRVLVVEDEPDMRRLVKINLADLGYEVTGAADGHEAVKLLDSCPFDLIVLDLMLPGVDGMEICRQVRARPSYVPILMLTARSTEIDRVLGLEQGADDYLTKPFSVRELMARVKAIFRRVEAVEQGVKSVDRPPIEIGDLIVDPLRRRVSIAGAEVRLTAKEFDLLLHFAQHRGRVFSRAELLDAVWGYGYDGYEHTVNSHINRLRAKIETDRNEPRYILTVWGVGYSFCDEQNRLQSVAGEA